MPKEKGRMDAKLRDFRVGFYKSVYRYEKLIGRGTTDNEHNKLFANYLRFKMGKGKLKDAKLNLIKLARAPNETR